jgi:hypothetical protein
MSELVCYVLTVYNQDTGDRDTFGPYAYDELAAVVADARAHYATLYPNPHTAPIICTRVLTLWDSNYE